MKPRIFLFCCIVILVALLVICKPKYQNVQEEYNTPAALEIIDEPDIVDEPELVLSQKTEKTVEKFAVNYQNLFFEYYLHDEDPKLDVTEINKDSNSEYTFLIDFIENNINNTLLYTEEELKYDIIIYNLRIIDESENLYVLLDVPIRSYKNEEYQNIYVKNFTTTDNNQETLIFITSPFYIGVGESVCKIILFDSIENNYSLLDVFQGSYHQYHIAPYYEKTELTSIVDKYAHKIAPFRTKFSNNFFLFTYNHSPPSHAFNGIAFYIFEIIDHKICLIFDGTICGSSVEFHEMSEASQAISMYEEKDPERFKRLYSNGSKLYLFLMFYAYFSFEDADGIIEIKINGQQDLIELDMSNHMFTYNTDDWKILMPVEESKLTYNWNEQEQKYVVTEDEKNVFVEFKP